VSAGLTNGLREFCELRIVRRTTPDERGVNGEVSQHVVQSVDVVGVGVGRYDVINLFQTSPPQVFRHDRFTDAARRFARPAK
jgi:hypothetical protein